MHEGKPVEPEPESADPEADPEYVDPGPAHPERDAADSETDPADSEADPVHREPVGSGAAQARGPGPDVACRVNGERVVVLGWGRAILLQFAHPLVAAGVADHTGFHGGTVERLRRLRNTVEAMLAFTFGPPEAADRAARAVNAIHDRVHGRLSRAVGPFGAGTPYSARDPRLLAWVHATVVDSSLRVYEELVAPLTPKERDRYWDEARAIGPLLDIPEGHLPASSREAHRYLDGMLASGTVTVSETGRELARRLLWPPPGPDLPAQWVVRLFALGLLPPSVRDQYGFPWGASHEAALRRVKAGIRTLVRLAPARVRHWRRARHRPPREEVDRG